MECMCEIFAFPHAPQAHAFYEQQAQQQLRQSQIYGAYLPQQPPQMEEHHLAYGGPEYAGFPYPQGSYYDEFEDAGEPSTRPRLTKEQVEVLEKQFQDNHKPTSVQKRQLAMQTMLSLPRVANWFQNRRAKAKQQKKQEEYECSQARNNAQELDTEDSKPNASAFEPVLACHESPGSHTSRSRPSSSPVSAFPHPVNDLRDTRLASYASVDRLRAHQPMQSQPSITLQSSNLDSSVPVISHQRSLSTISQTQLTQWPQKAELMEAWSEHPQHFQDTSFNFGFSDTSDASQQEYQHAASFSSSMLPPDPWPQSMPMPPTSFHGSASISDGLHSPDLPLPTYPDSRRGSGTESLAANFGTFALGTPVQEVPEPFEDSDLPQPHMHLDLAARRKRPRPAALTSASLRSRSYGALTATSPTVRSGFTPPSHAIRHVKSTGHSLNTHYAHYAGIRKPSSAQRSPLNVSTFAEAEFKTLLAQHASDSGPLTGTTLGSVTPIASPGLMINTQVADCLMSQKEDHARAYQLAASQHLTLSAASPPATPFATDYVGHSHFQAPPVSAPPQYASFADTTPPYSAGPMTNSSWPDAPLTSPDVPNFPVDYLPPLPTLSEPPLHGYSNFVLPSDAKHVFDGVEPGPDNKPTEFYIQEFPNQREEHAHVAQQLTSSKPRSYVFANSAPSDYDQQQP